MVLEEEEVKEEEKVEEEENVEEDWWLDMFALLVCAIAMCVDWCATEENGWKKEWLL